MTITHDAPGGIPPVDAPDQNRRRPISKHLRFQILRRDNHTCRYCGAKAPDVPIKVDHVTPVVLGGTNDPGNLVASCNAGKSALPPDAPLVADVAQDALRWATAREVAAAEVRQADNERWSKCLTVAGHWCRFYEELTKGREPSEEDLTGLISSIGIWLDRGLTTDDMCRLIDTAVRPRARQLRRANLIQYFAGCCWNLLRQIDEIAQEIIAEEEAALEEGEFPEEYLGIGWLTKILIDFCSGLPQIGSQWGLPAYDPDMNPEAGLLNHNVAMLEALVKIADVGLNTGAFPLIEGEVAE